MREQKLLNIKLAPIIIFTYRRKIDRLIETLLANKLSKRSELYIFSDGNKNEKDFEDVQDVRTYLQTIKGFKNINIIESSINKGLANSIIDGVSKVMDKYTKVIVLEDDLIVSSDFLEYMNDALNFYENDNKIWSISAYAPKLQCLDTLKDDIYLSPRASSWGWATWKDRWEIIDWEVNDFVTLKVDKSLKHKFNLGGNDMYKMLELQMLGKIDSWAIRWCYSQFRYNRYTIYPKKSKIINDGFNDNKGTHNSGKNSKLTLELHNNSVQFKELHREAKIIECFKIFHDLSLKTKIGYFLKKYGGYGFAKRLLQRSL
jgi:hypothetical protein